MDHFTFEHGTLHADGVAVPEIVGAYGSPVFIYCAATIRHHVKQLRSAFGDLDPHICYAVKSNSNRAIIQLLADMGAGMDLVSGGELYRVQRAGVDPATCAFAGVGKTDDEIRAAIEAGVGWINVESAPEFENVAAIAASMGAFVNIALRVNPDIDPGTHEFTTTGTSETKFGVDLVSAADFFDRYRDVTSCRLTGLHVHLGSPIYDPAPYRRALARMSELIASLRERGHHIDMLDIGGGFGADYASGQTPPMSDYVDVMRPALEPLVASGVQIVLEPGRMIVANAGILVTRVLYVKQGVARRFIICDAGMNVLVRPSHYDAFHFIWPVTPDAAHVPEQRTEAPDMPGLDVVDVVGPICETGDFLARQRSMAPVQRGDLLAAFSAGAYGMSMASQYNSQPRPTEVMVEAGVHRMISRRETYDDLIRHECAHDAVVENATELTS